MAAFPGPARKSRIPAARSMMSRRASLNVRKRSCTKKVGHDELAGDQQAHPSRQEPEGHHDAAAELDEGRQEGEQRGRG
jgi:hypothetical protein